MSQSIRRQVGAAGTSPRYSAIEATYLPAVEGAMREFLRRMDREGMGCNASMTRYHLSTGGKRLRALIPCWIFALYGRDPLQAVPLGCALELIHNATLVHDDLQDRDVVRRGQPTVWKKFSDAQAINCGDALFHFALEILRDFRVEPEIWKRISLRLSRGVLQVIEGQAQEFLMKEENYPGWERYLEVVTGKTAALFATAVVCALEALGEAREMTEWAETSALSSGVLFQIQDDLLDVYGDKQRERRGSDIAEGKISALVAAFHEIASPEEKARVGRVLRASRESVADAEIEDVIRVFESRGVKEIVVARMKELRTRRPVPAESWGAREMSWFFDEVNELFLKPIRDLCN